MKCRQCGNIISPGAKYCAYCGAPLFVPRDASILPRVPAWVMLLTVLIIIGAAAGVPAVLFWPSDSATSPVYYKPTTSISTPITTITTLVAPRLISPVQGAMLDNGSTDFSDNLVWSFNWDDVPRATYYHLYVISQNSPSPAINKRDINSSSYTYNSGYASAGCIWTWRVRAYIGGQWGPWSETRTFCVEDLNTDILSGCDNYADLGNPDDEKYHNLVGWAGIRVDAYGSTVPSARSQSLRTSNSLILCVPQVGVSYTLTTKIEDGNCDDSFSIYINDRLIYTYQATKEYIFPTHEVIIPSSYITSRIVKVTFKNNSTDQCGHAAVFFVKLEPYSESHPITTPTPVNTPAITILTGCDNYADLGNPNDEKFHNLEGWEWKEALSENTESGDKTVRFQSLSVWNSLYLCVPTTGIDYTLTIQTHDGSCDDSFWIYVNDQGPICQYQASPNKTYNPLHRINIGSRYITSKTIKITFRNTAQDSCGLAGVYFVKLEPK